MLRTAAITTALLLTLSACSSDADTSTSTEASTETTGAPATTAAPTTEPEAEEVELEALSGLEGAIGEASDRALSWFNGATFDEAAYEAGFDDTFRGEISFDQLIPLLEQIRGDAPYEVRSVQRSTDTEAELIIAGASGEEAMLAVAVVAADNPTMAGLFIGPAEAPTFEAPSLPMEAVDRLEEMGTLRFGAFTEACVPLDQSQPVTSTAINEQAPIGSGFKLWVLAAVVDAVEAGTVSWDDELEVRDELDSIPSGITQDDADGTMLTVRELAERMIEISDNTATDHLMDLVGREAVEQAMTNSGHSAPDRNVPFMNTREFTIVKFTDDEFRARYLAADADQRRQILDDEVASMPLPPLTNITSVTDPIDVESLEWFASPVDLCQVLTSLADNSEAAAILARNPGMPDESGLWSSILFKGGSEPGVLTMAWLMIDEEGSRSVVAGSVANESELIDEFEAANLLAYLRDATGGGA